MIDSEKRRPSVSRMGIAMIVLAVALLGLMGWGLANNNQTRPQVGDEAPDVQFVFFEGYAPETAPIDAQGETHLADYAGRIVVLNFWGSRCIPCITEVPELEAFHQKYKGEVDVLGVAYADIEKNSIEFLQKYRVSYGNAPDLGRRLSNTYHIVEIPETFVIAPDGTLAASFFGPVTSDQLEAVVESLR